MRLGRWEVQQTPDMRGWRISGGRDLPITDQDLDELAELIRSVRTPRPAVDDEATP